MSFYASLPDPTPSDFKFYSFFTRFGQERADLTRINFRFTIRSSADRHVRRLLLSVEERGDAAVIHGLRGQPSNRKLATALEQKILARVRQRYADFGPTLASEHLAKDELLVSRETAEAIQLRLEYNPAPPFNAGSPYTAPPEILALMKEKIAPAQARRGDAIHRAAARLT